jgi:diacylglycerol kinase (ATP)
MKNALLIVNPHSGKKNGEREAGHIREKLAAREIECTVFVSHKISDLERFLKDCLPGDFDFVGIVGGDGTMHAFLNIVLNQYDHVPVPVALFPCGTGNAFNFDIGCSTVEETLKNIFAGNCTYVDIAEVHCGTDRLWSFNILGCGLVTEINRLAENLRFLGSSRYTVASVIKLLANPKTPLKIKTEQGKFEGRFSFVLACNTRYTGKGMLMAPHAKLNDGKFDVIVVRACSALKLLMLFPKIFKGKHLDADVLSYFQSDTLEVSSDNFSQPTNIDGELKGQIPFSLKVHRNKIKVFVHQTRKSET